MARFSHRAQAKTHNAAQQIPHMAQGHGQIADQKSAHCLLVQKHARQSPHHRKPPQAAVALPVHQLKNVQSTKNPESQILQGYQQPPVGQHPPPNPQDVIDEGNQDSGGKGVQQKYIFLRHRPAPPVLPKQPGKQGFRFARGSARHVRISEAVDPAVNVHFAFVQHQPAHMQFLALDHEHALFRLQKDFMHVKGQNIVYAGDAACPAVVHRHLVRAPSGSI